MKAARLHHYGQPLVIEEVPTPKPAPGEILVRVEGAGFCHSDIHVMDGDIPVLPRMPLILGHENAGAEATLALAVAATRSLGKVSQIGLAGGAARMKVLENTRFEVQFEATLWGTVKELREVIALAETGRLTSISIELAPLERINDVYGRLKRGKIPGRAVITPAA